MNAYLRRKVVTAPSAEPFTTAEAKSHLRVDHSNEDTYIDGLVKVARQVTEALTNLTLITTSLKNTYDKFPGRFKLLYGPIQSVTHIKYYDTANEQQTYSSDNYQVDAESNPGRVALDSTVGAWPSTYAGRLNAVEVQYVAGFGDASTDIPDSLLHAMRLMIGHWYEHREEVVLNTVANKLPLGAKLLLSLECKPEQV